MRITWSTINIEVVPVKKVSSGMFKSAWVYLLVWALSSSKSEFCKKMSKINNDALHNNLIESC